MVIEIPFRAVTAVPGSENPRRSRGFTIESLIGTDLERNNKRDSVCSQPAHHHPPLPPPPPPPPVGHVSSNGALTSPLLPLGANSLSSSSSSASSPSSSSSSLSSSSVSPNGNHHTASSGGPVTSTSLTTSLSLSSKNTLKCSVDHTNNHVTHHHGKNSISINNSNNYSGSNNRNVNNMCTSSSNSSSSSTTTITSHSNNNNNNKNNCNKQNSLNGTSRSPSPITSPLSDGGRSNTSNNNITATNNNNNNNDNNNNINGTGKSDGSPISSRLVSVAHHHHYPQHTPLGLVTHSIEKSLLTEDKERFSHHQHHHTQQSQNQQQNYHHHHHHHSPPVPSSNPVGATGTTGSSAGLHYPLKCVQNTEDYYRGTASGFTPVRLCNHPLGSAVTVAAAAAAAAAAGTAPTWTGVLPPTSPAAAAAAAAAMGPVNMSLYRDHTLFNPWMFARCAGYLGHRYPVNHDGAFLLPPYRKPKRIRTAFSPAQLLQLEEAFEKNHYVVGQERKELAADLKLTETQVKVWFQNRRTKHKRMKAEEEATSASASTTREEPTSSSRARPKEMDIDPTGIEPIEYDGSDENSDSEPMRTDT